jgi:hypothetical protein
MCEHFCGFRRASIPFFGDLEEFLAGSVPFRSVPKMFLTTDL